MKTVPGQDGATGVSGSCEAFPFTRELFCCNSDGDISAVFVLRPCHPSFSLVESYWKQEHWVFATKASILIWLHHVDKYLRLQKHITNENAILRRYSLQEMIEF